MNQEIKGQSHVLSMKKILGCLLQHLGKYENVICDNLAVGGGGIPHKD